MPKPIVDKVPASEAEAKIAWNACMVSRLDLVNRIFQLRALRRNSRIKPGAVFDMSTLVRELEDGTVVSINTDESRANVPLNLKIRNLEIEAHGLHLTAWNAWLGVQEGR